jgi:(S)-mandelate dehydrogenase
MKVEQAVNIEDLRAIARRRMPRFVFDYVDGGAEDETTLRANRAALEALRFQPRTLVDVSQRSARTTILGGPSALPVIAGPVGLLGLSWRDGDLELARAASAAGVPYGVSTVSMHALEDVARIAGGRAWFQCYVFRQRAISDALVRRAAAAGYEALIITSDFPVPGKRERDLRSGLLPLRKLTLRTKVEVLRLPRWVKSVATRRPRFVNVEQELARGQDAASFTSFNMFDPALDWDDFRRFRDLWQGKLLLKGVLRVDDAARAVAYGADAVVLSNHGGRQLDGAISGIDVLPDVVREIGSRASVIVDGGVRRGSDIAKALACGAEAVILGRAVNYGLGAGGAKGVARALEILREEFDAVLGLTGCCSPADLSPDLIRPLE